MNLRTRLTFLIRDLGFGGAQRQLVALATGLPRDEFEISVLHFHPGPLEAELRAAGIKTICVRKNGRWDLAGFFVRLVHAARAEQPDIFHSYLTESNVLAALLKPFLRGARIVWGLRDSQTDSALWGTLGKLSFRLCRLLSRRANRIIANSVAGRDYYISQGFPAGKISVIPNGIATDRFVHLQKTEPAEKSFVFGHVGRLNPMKDHATLLRAAASVFSKHRDARLVCVGGGDESYAAQMRHLAADLGIADKVTWLPPREGMPEVYQSFDALVSSSSFGEGFSNVVAEAMSCGVPCVVTDVGDSARIVGDTGFTVSPSQPEALAAAMCRLVETGSTDMAELRAHARSRIVENFSMPQLIRRTREILQQLNCVQQPAQLGKFLNSSA